MPLFAKLYLLRQAEQGRMPKAVEGGDKELNRKLAL